MFLKNHKKYIAVIMSIYVLVSLTVSFGQDTIIDISDVSDGRFTIVHDGGQDQRLMVLVEKDDEQAVYQYAPNGTYPLNFGEGTYTLSLFEALEENRYKSIAVETVTVEFDKAMAPYVASTDLIDYEKNTHASAKASEWVEGLTTDIDKASRIYDELIHLLSYDEEKGRTASAVYVADSDETLLTETGICYDFATLYALMLRSQGIPTKVVMGHKADIDSYHAWNEVYLPQEGGWVSIDVTYGQSHVFANQTPPFIIDSSEYEVERFY